MVSSAASSDSSSINLDVIFKKYPRARIAAIRNELEEEALTKAESIVTQSYGSQNHSEVILDSISSQII